MQQLLSLSRAFQIPQLESATCVCMNALVVQVGGRDKDSENNTTGAKDTQKITDNEKWKCRLAFLEKKNVNCC